MKITNLRFADDIDGLAGTEDELTNLVERFDKIYTDFGMQINAEKTKLMTNNTNDISTDIPSITIHDRQIVQVNCTRLPDVTISHNLCIYICGVLKIDRKRRQQTTNTVRREDTSK